MPPCVMEKDWYRHVKEKSVSALLVPSDPQWPLLPRPKSAEQNVEGEQGKIYFTLSYSFLWALWNLLNLLVVAGDA